MTDRADPSGEPHEHDWMFYRVAARRTCRGCGLNQTKLSPEAEWQRPEWDRIPPPPTTGQPQSEPAEPDEARRLVEKWEAVPIGPWVESREALTASIAAALQAREERGRRQAGIENARLITGAGGEDDIALYVWGPGRPGERGCAHVSFSGEPDEDGVLAVVRPWHPQIHGGEFIGIRTLAELHAHLKAIQAAIRALSESPVSPEKEKT